MNATRYDLIDAGYEYVGDRWPEVARASEEPPSLLWHVALADALDDMGPLAEVWHQSAPCEWFVYLPQHPTLE